MMSICVWTVLVVMLHAGPGNGEFKRVCYMTSWSQYRPGPGRFTVSSITQPSLCTHIILAFARVNSTSSTLEPYEKNEGGPRGTYEQLVALRESRPGLKILLSVGGSAHGSAPFVEVISEQEKLETFCGNVIDYIRRIGFDGVDVDWEWPSDKQRFTVLLHTLRRKIHEESVRPGGATLLLTAAVSATKAVVDVAYEVNKIHPLVDFLSVMTYNMDVFRGPRLLHHAPLYSRHGDSAEDMKHSVHYSMTYWLNKGAPRHKIVLGLPLYGKYYSLKTSELTSLYDPSRGNSSVLYYYQICRKAKDPNWTYVWDDVAKTPILYSKDTWVGYDNLKSIALKAKYIRQEGLGGAMVWEMSQDDFGGTFCNQGRFPLLTKVSDVLTASQDECAPGMYGQLTKPGCLPCPRGTYQPDRSKTGCLPCGTGKTTYGVRAKEDYQCLDYCTTGQEYSYADRKCVLCPVGFVRQQVASAYCVKCPVYYITLSTGSDTCVPLPDGLSVGEVKTMNYHFALAFTISKTCSNAEVLFAAIRLRITNAIKASSRTWPALCSAGCRNVDIVRLEGCRTGSRRRRRETSDSDKRITVRSIIKDIPQELVSTPVTQTRLADSVISELFFNRESFSGLSVYGIQYQGMAERMMELKCDFPSGYAFQGNICAPCPVGTFKHTASGQCVSCAEHYYQDKVAQSTCIKCPGNTKTVGTRATTRQDCINPCGEKSDLCGSKGRCAVDSETFKTYCLCSESYSGETCSIRTAGDGVGIAVVVGGIVGGLGSILIIVLVMLMCCFRGRPMDQSRRRLPHISKEMILYPNLMALAQRPSPLMIMADPYHVASSVQTVDPRYSSLRGVTTPRIVVLDSPSTQAQTDLTNTPVRTAQTPTESPRPRTVVSDQSTDGNDGSSGDADNRSLNFRL